MNNLVIKSSAMFVSADSLLRLIELATDGLEDNTRIAYGRHLTNFLTWLNGLHYGGFERHTVQAYKQHLKNQDYAPATINQALTAIRRLAEEGKYVGLDPLVAEGIIKVKNVAKAGRRLGKWLSPDQVKFLFDCTEDGLKGHQERAMLALLAGCALRRAEAATATWEQLQQRDGGWYIVDLVGKGNKTRSVPVSPWAKKLLDKWSQAAGIGDGLILRAVDKTGKLTGSVRTRGGGRTNGGVSDKAIYKNVVAISERCGIDVEPHSLRRTWARRAYKQGFPLDQIQLILGHASIRTTELYIGIRGLDLESPVYVTY